MTMADNSRTVKLSRQENAGSARRATQLKLRVPNDLVEETQLSEYYEVELAPDYAVTLPAGSLIYVPVLPPN